MAHPEQSASRKPWTPCGNVCLPRRRQATAVQNNPPKKQQSRSLAMWSTPICALLELDTSPEGEQSFKACVRLVIKGAKAQSPTPNVCAVPQANDDRLADNVFEISKRQSSMGTICGASRNACYTLTLPQLGADLTDKL